MSEESNKELTNKQTLFTTQKRKRSNIKKKHLFRQNNQIQSRDEIKQPEQKETKQIEQLDIQKATELSELKIDSTNKNNNLKQESKENQDSKNKQRITSNRNDDLIISAIEVLKSEDVEEISEVLHELSEKLSIAHESIAENPNCPNLIKELVKMMSKSQEPELLIQVLNSINYLLDIHPYFCNTIMKYEGIKHIVNLTQNVEYIDLAEIAIKAIEKISHENVNCLVENSAFSSILLYVDFFDMNTKKYVVQSCLNMTRYIRNNQIFKNQIEPGISQLTSLTKFAGNTEIEKNILNQSILCFYNIFYSIKNYRLHVNDPKIWENVIQYNFLDNLIEILEIFLKMIRGSRHGDTSQNVQKDKSKLNTGSFMDIFKSVIKVFQLVSENSVTISNILINKKIIQLIYSFLNEELDYSTDSNNITDDKNKSAVSNHLIFNEIFPFIFSFFPNEKSKDKEEKQLRLIVDNKSEVYLFLSQKIIPLIVNNFINISSSHISIKVLKLINIYTHYSLSNNLRTYLDAWKLANIISKMLDSNDALFLFEVFEIIEDILNKTPESYLIELLREGVVDIIKFLTIVSSKQLYVNLNTQSNITTFKEIISINENLIIQEENEKNNHDNFKELQQSSSIANNPNQMIVDEEENESINVEEDEENFEADEDNQKKQENSNAKINDISQNQNKSNSNCNNFNNFNISKKTIEMNILYIIRQKAKKFMQKFFSTDFINDIFDKLKIKDNFNENPYIIFENLMNISKKIKDSPSNYFDQELVKEFFDSILNRSNITFYEIQKSEIVKNFVNYMDNNFSTKRLNNKSNFSTFNHDAKIVDKLRIVFTSLNRDITIISKVITLLQRCISSINCFSVCIYEYSNYKNTSHLFLNAYKSQIQKFKINFLYIKDEDTLNEYGIDSRFKELHDFYSDKSSNVMIEIDQNETFQNLKEAILKRTYKGSYLASNSNTKSYDSYLTEDNKKLEEIVATLSQRRGSEDFENTEAILAQLLERKQSTLSQNEDSENLNTNLLPVSLRHNLSTISSQKNKYDVSFFIQINTGEEIYINNKWSFNDFIKSIKENYKKETVNSYLEHFKIFFKITVKEFDSAYLSETDLNRRMSIQLGESIQDIFHQNLKENFIEEIIFNKHYLEKIINNEALYSIGRISSYLYLITLFELSINHFPYLFKICGKLKENILVNGKISTLLIKQVRDPYAISSNTIPQWCKEFSQNFYFLSSFNSRYLYFKTCTFDLRRSMMNLYVYIKNYIGDFNTENKTQSGLKRKKIIIDREKILKSTEKLLKENGNYSGYLEFEFLNEAGSGIGPTLEFYSIFIRELTENIMIWYKNSEATLFPAPFLSKLIGFEQNERNFSLLGFVVARGLYDDRLMDIPLNRLFWDILLDRPVSFNKINLLDKDIGRTIIEFLELIEIKKNILSSKFNEDNEDPSIIQKFLENNLLYKNAKLQDLCVNFVIPGYDIEMVEDGHNILLSAENIENYINLLTNSFCYEGIKDSVNAFKNGFNIVFPYTSLNCFSSEELSEYLCGNSREEWDFETLCDNIMPNHGYDKNSHSYLNFINFLLKLDKVSRKNFLLFVTGSPRLPLGGFKNLIPKLTVVKRYPNIPNENPDKYLPTVMTCQNYLKIPDYSSFEILSQRFLFAMNEGSNSFDLS